MLSGGNDLELGVNPNSKGVQKAAGTGYNGAGTKRGLVNFCQKVKVWEGVGVVVKVSVQKFSLRSSEGREVFLEPLLDPGLNLFHVIGSLRFGQLLVGDMVKEMFGEGDLDISVPFDDGGTEVFVT